MGNTYPTAAEGAGARALPVKEELTLPAMPSAVLTEISVTSLNRASLKHI